MTRADAGAVRRGALEAASAGLLVTAAAAWAAQPWLGVSPGYPLTAALLFSGGMAMAVRFAGTHHPFSRFGPANQTTTVRAALVALVAALTIEPVTRPIAAAATTLAALVCALDGVDGWVARRTGMSSPFGARFDVETDSIFVLVLSVLVWRYEKAGIWVIAGGLYRYLFVAAAWMLPWMAGPLRPTNRARVVAACHMLGLTVAIAPIIPTPLSTVLVTTSLAALTWSFAADVGRLWRGDTA